MKVSEITLDVLKQYLRVAGAADDILLKAILAGAIQFSVNYTGLSETDLDDKPDMPLAILALCSDMYEVRQATVTGLQINPTVAQILGSYCQNFL